MITLDAFKIKYQSLKKKIIWDGDNPIESKKK
jgi:hypothetical protein